MNPLLRSVLAALLVMLAAAGCAGEATQVYVTIDAEPGVRLDSARLRLVVLGGVGRATSPTASRFERILTPGASNPAYPFDIALAPVDGDVGRSYAVVATAQTASGDFVAEARLIGGYVAGRALRVRLVLEDACRTVRCGDNETCRAGVCVDARINVRNPDAGPADAGFDAGIADLGVDSGFDAGRDSGIADMGVDAGIADSGVDAGITDLGVDGDTNDMGWICVNESVTYITGAFCSLATQSCIDRCTTGTCVVDCFRADLNSDCYLCVNRNVIACANMAGCTSQWNSLDCCTQENCTGSTDVNCVSDFCLLQRDAFSACANRVLPTTACTQDYTSCF